MKRWVAAAGVLFSAAMLFCCRRTDIRTVRLHVPEMNDALDVRIITNAVLDVVMGGFDGTQNACEVDLAAGVVVYHEGPRLLRPEYVRHLEASIRKAGFEARTVKVAHNPPPPILTKDGYREYWRERCTATIRVEGMQTVRAANVVVDAIGCGRAGDHSDRVVVDPVARRLTVTYDSTLLSLSNLEHAVACAGYTANRVPSKLGGADAVPHGWTPLTAAPAVR